MNMNRYVYNNYTHTPHKISHRHTLINMCVSAKERDREREREIERERERERVRERENGCMARETLES